ncbi:MAG: RecQ family ATP-dependent DNA helicase [Gaiellales bacterium]
MAPDPHTLLREVFGHDAFRPGQEAAVEAALAGRDALVVMPTGSGKSLCYQLPALGALRLTIVVSPLLALMRDQVEALRALGRDDVAQLSSDTPSDEVERVLAALRGPGASLLEEAPAVRLLYVAPERFANARFAAALADAEVDLLVVDEAHCLSEWGHDFRPDYGRLAQVRERIRPRAVMALTATATRQTSVDIMRRLGLQDPLEVHTGFDRPNLAFDAIEAAGRARRLQLLEHGLADPAARPAIVYVRTRKDCEMVAEALVAAGLPAAAYHAGLERTERQARQDAFMASDARVMVATTAFGMGVDKADIRAVWHWGLPQSLEAYSQESGRAGRDGAPARCVLLHSPGDRGVLGALIRRASFGADEVNRVLAALAQLAEPGTGAFAVNPAELARMAGAGEDDVRAWLASAEAVGAAELEPGSSSTWRGRLRLRGLGADRAEDVRLRARRIDGGRWDRLDAAQAYAAGTGCRRRALLAYFGDDEQPRADERCCDVCDPIDVPAETAATRSRSRRRTAVEIPADAPAALVEQLKAWRSETAKAQGVPAYVVAKDATLHAIAAVRPTGPAALEALPGVGPAFMERHAAAVLAIVGAWADDPLAA